MTTTQLDVETHKNLSLTCYDFEVNLSRIKKGGLVGTRTCDTYPGETLKPNQTQASVFYYIRYSKIKCIFWFKRWGLGNKVGMKKKSFIEMYVIIKHLQF